jgi:transposase-like protein
MANHDPELRAKLLADWLKPGATKKGLARDYGVPLSTVKRWTNDFVASVGPGGQVVNPSDEPLEPYVSPRPPVDIRQRVLELVDALLGGSIAMAELAQDKEWLKKQSAADVGNLLGITTDRAAGILAALERGAELRRQYQLDQAQLASGVSDPGD